MFGGTDVGGRLATRSQYGSDFHNSTTANSAITVQHQKEEFPWLLLLLPAK